MEEVKWVFYERYIDGYERTQWATSRNEFSTNWLLNHILVGWSLKPSLKGSVLFHKKVSGGRTCERVFFPSTSVSSALPK